MSAIPNDGGMDDGFDGSTESHDRNGVVGINNDATARNAISAGGNGVLGFTQVPDGAGVLGVHNTGGIGVTGVGHPAGVGVLGLSAPPGAKGGDGVQGITNSEHRNGIFGRNDATTARAAADPGGNGVFGFTQVPDGAGVFGANGANGVGVAGLGLVGVSGGSLNGVGVMGVSAPPGAKGGDGVQGITNSEHRNGIYGRNDSADKRNTTEPAGNGVLGFTQVPDGAGVLGVNGAGGVGVAGTGFIGVSGAADSNNPQGIGLFGQGGADGVSILGRGGWRAGRFEGDVDVTGNTDLAGNLQLHGSAGINGSLQVDGNISVTGDVLLANQDIAERFEVEPECGYKPGMVMVLGERGAITPCTQSYDKRAIGVISGAGTLRPAVMLGEKARSIPTAPIALIGTAYCWADAVNGPVDVGDPMTTSDRLGHAMKATDPFKGFGTVIGKALAPLPEGHGLIPILLSRQ